MTSTSFGSNAWATALGQALAGADGATVEVAGTDLPDLGPSTVDTVIVTSPLDSLQDPLAVLRTVRSWLRPSGTLTCIVTNLARHDVLTQLLRSDPQSAPRGVVQPTAKHIHGYATAFKLLLEAGYSPDIASIIEGERGPAPEFLDAVRSLLEYTRVDPDRAAKHLAAEYYVFTARPIANLEVPSVGERPLTFVACVNDDAQLNHNLMASPIFGDGSPHELLLYRGMDSAAQGLNRGIREAQHDLVVLVQQDTYLPSWWPARLAAQWDAASESGAPAIAGPFGLRYREGGRTHVGHAIDRDNLLQTPHKLPADVDGLDELVMVVPRSGSLRFDPALGWHLYGTDLVLQARAAGRRAVVLDVPCHHNSLFSALDDAYRHAEAVLAAKWPRELPILTNSSTIDQDPRDVRLAALEAQLAEAHASVEDSRRRAAAAERAAAKQKASLTEMKRSRTWRYGRMLAALTGRR